jgi:hypothetical protein
MTFHIPESDEGLAPQLPEQPRREAPGGYTQVPALQVTVDEETPYLPPAAAGEPNAFYVAAVEYLRWRLARASQRGEDISGVVTFVQVEYPRLDAEPRHMERVPGFKFADDVDLIGRLFVVSGSLSDAYAAEVARANVGTAYVAVDELRLADRPAVIADLATGEVIWCPMGTAREDNSRRLPIQPEPAQLGESTLTIIQSTLEQFHAGWFGYPEAHLSVWADENRFVPAPDVEPKIQGLLFTVLWSRMRDTHIVRKEDTVIDGRYDLSIAARPGSGAVGTTVVGIGVLRSMQATALFGGPPVPVGRAENEHVIESGLHTAEYYKTSLGCTEVTWCLFDMQQADDGGALVVAFEAGARARNVFLQRLLVPNRARGASGGSQN